MFGFTDHRCSLFLSFSETIFNGITSPHFRDNDKSSQALGHVIKFPPPRLSLKLGQLLLNRRPPINRGTGDGQKHRVRRVPLNAPAVQAVRQL